MPIRRDSSFDDYLAETLKDPAEAAAYIEATLELEGTDGFAVSAWVQLPRPPRPINVRPPRKGEDPQPSPLNDRDQPDEEP